MARGQDSRFHPGRLLSRMSHAMRGNQNDWVTAGGNDPEGQRTVGQHDEWTSGQTQKAHPGFEDEGMPDPFNKEDMQRLRGVQQRNAVTRSMYGSEGSEVGDPFNTPQQDANLAARQARLGKSWAQDVEDGKGPQPTPF